MSAKALVPTTGQVFEQVAHLLVPEAAPEVLDAQIVALRGRLGDVPLEEQANGLRDARGRGRGARPSWPNCPRMPSISAPGRR